jgi:cob(I)alamin adenosyltransferase
MIEENLVARIKTIAANVYPIVAPKAFQRPCVVYNRIGTNQIRSLDPATGGDEAAFVTFQIDVYSASFLEAKTLARKIKRNLVVWSEEDVQTTQYINEVSSVDNTTETALYRVMTVFEIFCAD